MRNIYILGIVVLALLMLSGCASASGTRARVYRRRIYLISLTGSIRATAAGHGRCAEADWGLPLRRRSWSCTTAA